MGRESLMVRAGRFLQRFPLAVFRPLEWPFVRGGARRSEAPLIILLALPRSGSTLAYQVLCHGLDCHYLSNIGNLFYQLPFLGGVLSDRLCRRYESKFRSQQGFVPGLCGPAEGLAFWRYWLDSPIDERQSGAIPVSRRDRRGSYLHAAFNALATESRPVVTGYVGHVLVVERLREVFPHALFVRLYRDPLRNALSLLACRRNSSGNDWFSVLPSECRLFLNRSIHEQVAAQVYWLNRRINSYDRGDFIDINYEDLCAGPEEIISKIVHDSKKIGLELSRRNKLPEQFPTKNINSYDREDVEKVKQYLDVLEEQHGHL